MSESEARVSGDLARLMANHCDLERLLVEHAPDEKGRCAACRSIGCSTYPAVLAAVQLRAKRDAKFGKLHVEGSSA
jgi:hypothetical protein